MRIDGATPTPHFLGAAVLEPQKREGLIGVDTLNIIDGQQRLTTLQYFLAALAIVLRSQETPTLLSILEGCLRNGNIDTMRNPEIEIYKVWPTFRDRANFQLAMNSQNLDELRSNFPSSFTQSGSLRKVGVVHAPALEAIWYFAEQIGQWIAKEEDGSMARRLTAVVEAVFSDLQLVTISLGEQDDAQVIFETLNGRGAQLHATDLIRNFIFMRADREGAASAELYDTLWSQFESGYWSDEQRRGRLNKPRMEWFVQAALQAALGDEVEIGRLYVAYRRFADGTMKPLKAAEQLGVLNDHAVNYRELLSGAGTQPIARYGRRVAAWDATTSHAMALRIAATNLPENAQAAMFDDLTSYFVRRAICGLPPKNYNKFFLSMIKRLAAKELTPETLRAALSNPDSPASRWPHDDEFRKAWLTGAMYPGNLDPARVRSILVEIEAAMRPPQSEELVPTGLDVLDIDHILPTKWYQYWPLADGSSVGEAEANSLALQFLFDQPLDERKSAIRQREQLKTTFGNLTLLHYGVNRSLQHREFPEKRAKLLQVSNLHLNRMLMLRDNWDEKSIAERGSEMLEYAVKIWAGPRS